MFGASFVAMGIGAIGAVAIGAVVALIVGMIFTMAEGTSKAAPSARPAPSVPAPEPAPKAEAVVAPAASINAEPVADSTKPKGLDGPLGTADDLKRIGGVGPVLEGKLNALGIFHFWQIAKWSRAEVDWVDSYLSFKGRIDRDDWLAQAERLAEDTPPA